MSQNLNLKNIDDLIYFEGSNLQNVDSKDIGNIQTYYSAKRKSHKKNIKNNPSLFIYDYRTPVIDFSNENWMKSAPIDLDTPALQPHDSKIKNIQLADNSLKILGSGNSYMNYQNYDFDINFNGLNNLSILESNYSNFNKESVNNLSLEELKSKIAHATFLTFREVFLEESETLKNVINFVFIDYTEEDIDKEKRNIIVLKFEFDSADVTCEPIPLKQKKAKKLK